MLTLGAAPSASRESNDWLHPRFLGADRPLAPSSSIMGRIGGPPRTFTLTRLHLQRRWPGMEMPTGSLLRGLSNCEGRSPYHRCHGFSVPCPIYIYYTYAPLSFMTLANGQSDTLCFFLCVWGFDDGASICGSFPLIDERPCWPRHRAHRRRYPCSDNPLCLHG
jgi:hypothetical protein